MLVDNSLQQSLFSPSPFTDLSDIFNTEEFFSSTTLPSQSQSHSHSPASISSRASSPSSLLTPPQSTPPSSFPDIAYPSSSSSSFFNFLDDNQSQPKHTDPSSSNPYDFISAFGGSDIIDFDAGMNMAMDIRGDAQGMSMDMGMNIDQSSYSLDALLANATNSGSMNLGIDPQLVGTPSSFDPDEQSFSPFATEEESLADEPQSHPQSQTQVDQLSNKKLKAKKPSPAPSTSSEDREKLTLTIAPIKAGGHGKARKGTVVGGGITKKSASSSSTPAYAQVKASPIVVKAPSVAAGKAAAANANTKGDKDKENAQVAQPLPVPSALTSYMPTNIYPPKSTQADGSAGKEGGDDEEDDLPQDWRPSPEVFQKMTSKEKRQLRNKISARNFRVRRKEYISTLEGDIAERDRLLDAIRSELGSTQSENLALRQEIAALKRTLLDGRGVSVDARATVGAGDELPMLNLPPPAPLPAQSAAVTLQQQQQQVLSPPLSPKPALSSSSASATLAQLLTPNPHKDVSASSSSFWGGARLGAGVGLGMGGITPVHRVVLPEVNVNVVPRLQENLNPMLNMGVLGEKVVKDAKTFDAFADVNPFTMKTLDAYRMHLWGKMAAQHQVHQYQQHQQLLLQQQNQQLQQQPHLTGLASSLRPAFFSTPSSPSLSALLSGKHGAGYTSPPASPPMPYTSPAKMRSAHGYPTPPGSPVLGLKGAGEKLEKERAMLREREREREKEKETAMYAAIASQTLLRRLGSAFWDAFSGGAGAGAGASGGVGGGKAWDADKVRRVLEGKAVVRVVDVDDVGAGAGVGASVGVAASTGAGGGAKGECAQEAPLGCDVGKCRGAMVDILEESMRSLSLGKKA